MEMDFIYGEKYNVLEFASYEAAMTRKEGVKSRASYSSSN